MLAAAAMHARARPGTRCRRVAAVAGRSLAGDCEDTVAKMHMRVSEFKAPAGKHVVHESSSSHRSLFHVARGGSFW
jgi:hypothetical protein